MAGKRANGEGSVAKRPDGTWEARFSYEDPETGRTKRISSYGKTQAEARAKMREKRQRVEAGQPAKDSAIPLAEYAARWIETTLAVSDRKASTKQTYAHLSRRHLQGEGIGAVTLDKLRATHVEALILAMRDEGSSQSTVRQTYTVLRAILDAAVRDQLVARNVAALVKRPGVDRHEARFLSREEVVALLDASRGTRFAEFLSLLTLTGLRRGEALALRWVDVELEGEATIRIRGTLVRVGGVLTIT
ncbi:phage integrase N-terminal domain-containing protein, partial [Xanthomonas perforans]